MKIIILHDADARIEYLDVADHLLGSDIEEFLTRQGFSVNNITWLVTSADHIPVVYHKYDIDCKTGEATHTKREAELQDLTIHGQLQALQHREQDELKAALRKYGTEVDGGFEVHFEGEQPIVAGYLFDDGKSSVRCPLKPKRFYPLKIFNNAPSKSLDRWGYYYFSLFPSVCRHLPDTFSV